MQTITLFKSRPAMLLGTSVLAETRATVVPPQTNGFSSSLAEARVLKTEPLPTHSSATRCLASVVLAANGRAQ